MAEIGKQVTNAYYNRPAEYSYFSGCSGGGRQGLAMAQQFPDAFDGILAISPAINIESFIPAGYWPTQIMRIRYPPPCEIDAFVSAAVEACDGLDGVKDGIISLPYLCNVTAFDFVGKHYNWGTQHSLSSSKVVQEAWSGSRSKSREAGLPRAKQRRTSELILYPHCLFCKQQYLSQPRGASIRKLDLLPHRQKPRLRAPPYF